MTRQAAPKIISIEFDAVNTQLDRIHFDPDGSDREHKSVLRHQAIEASRQDDNGDGLAPYYQALLHAAHEWQGAYYAGNNGFQHI